jgi:hypothetical protein
MPCGQTHGLVAHRSIGDENGRFGRVAAAARQQLGQSLSSVGRLRFVGAPWSRATSPIRPGCRAAPQLRQREPGVCCPRRWCVPDRWHDWEIRRSWSTALFSRIDRYRNLAAALWAPLGPLPG